MELMKILNLADGFDEDAYEGIYEQWISYLFYSLCAFVFSRLLDFVDDFWQESEFETDIAMWCS